MEDALTRLKTDEYKIKNTDFSNVMSLDQLNSEKYKVKNELKQYDNEFQSLFRRLPLKSEKEIMRPLYLYYKKLKSAIEEKKSGNASQKYHSNNSSQGVSSGNSSSSSNTGVINTRSRITNTGYGSKDPHAPEANPINSNIYSFNNVYGGKEAEKKMIIEKNEKKNQVNTSTTSQSSSSSQSKSVQNTSKDSGNQNKEIPEDLFGGDVKKSNYHSNVNLATMNGILKLKKKNK